MCGCGKKSQVNGKAATPPETYTIQMTYTGSNRGPIQFKGYLNRKYRVKKGDQPMVHPDDVGRLQNTGRFVLPGGN